MPLVLYSRQWGKICGIYIKASIIEGMQKKPRLVKCGKYFSGNLKATGDFMLCYVRGRKRREIKEHSLRKVMLNWGTMIGRSLTSRNGRKESTGKEDITCSDMGGRDSIAPSGNGKTLSSGLKLTVHKSRGGGWKGRWKTCFSGEQLNTCN